MIVMSVAQKLLWNGGAFVKLPTSLNLSRRQSGSDHRVGGRHYFAISPLSTSLLDFWPAADMDLSREQQYISTRDTERWGRGRRCVLSADSTLVLVLCQFVWESVLWSQYFLWQFVILFLILWNLTNGLLFMWHCACHCPQTQPCPCCQYQAMNRGGR